MWLEKTESEDAQHTPVKPASESAGHRAAALPLRRPMNYGSTEDTLLPLIAPILSLNTLKRDREVREELHLLK